MENLLPDRIERESVSRLKTQNPDSATCRAADGRNKSWRRSEAEKRRRSQTVVITELQSPVASGAADQYVAAGEAAQWKRLHAAFHYWIHPH